MEGINERSVLDDTWPTKYTGSAYQNGCHQNSMCCMDRGIEWLIVTASEGCGGRLLSDSHLVSTPQQRGWQASLSSYQACVLLDHRNMHPVSGQAFHGPLLALWVDVSYRILINKHAFLTSKNVVWGNNIKVAFNMTLGRLNPTELSAGPSLQTYVVQKRIVQTHRTLF